jgi:hypothetical protein
MSFSIGLTVSDDECAFMTWRDAFSCDGIDVRQWWKFFTQGTLKVIKSLGWSFDLDSDTSAII